MFTCIDVGLLKPHLHEVGQLCAKQNQWCRFFCAIHPDMHKSWAQAWARNLRPGGTLVTLMFPLEPVGRSGPPWPVQEEAYAAVLEAAGFSRLSCTAVPAAEATTPARAGKEALAVWRKV